MGKKTLAPKAEKKQEVAGADWEKFKKTNDEKHKKLDAELKKISKMDFKDFKQAIIYQVKSLQVEIDTTDFALGEAFTDLLKNRKTELKIIGEKLHERDELVGKAFELRDEKLDKSATFSFVHGFVLSEHLNGPVSEEKNGIQLNYWDMTVKGYYEDLLKNMTASEAEI